jgi:hypothetical protein
VNRYSLSAYWLMISSNNSALSSGWNGVPVTPRRGPQG